LRHRAGDFDLSGVNRHDLNAEPMKKQIEFAAGHDTRRASSTMAVSNVFGAESRRDPSADEFEEILPLRLRQNMASRAEVSITISA